MPAIVASQQALIKCASKDDSYIKIMHSKVIKIFQHIFGDHFFMRWKRELEVISSLLYFYVTSLQGFQTLGEEYSGIIQVDSNGEKIPTNIKCLSFAFIHSASPYMMKKVIDMYHARFNAPKKSNKLNNSVDLQIHLHTLVSVMNKVNMLIFYINGVHLNFAKRVLGVKHWLIRPYASDEIDNSTFFWLAVLEFIQLITMFSKIGNEIKLHRISEEEVKKDTDKYTLIDSNLAVNTKCILCLQKIQDASSTFCGHVFCWQCIIEWTTAKSECPVCRCPCYPSRIVYLNHFELN